MSGRWPRIDFDAESQISPYTVYRRLTEGPELLLVDLRRPPAERPPVLAEALERPGAEWRPPTGIDVVLFDRDGREALDLARRLRADGHTRVRALFGGLELYELALAGTETQRQSAIG